MKLALGNFGFCRQVRDPPRTTSIHPTDHSRSRRCALLWAMRSLSVGIPVEAPGAHATFSLIRQQ
jgi:hypothetical protein